MQAISSVPLRFGSFALIVPHQVDDKTLAIRPTAHSKDARWQSRVPHVLEACQGDAYDRRIWRNISEINVGNNYYVVASAFPENVRKQIGRLFNAAHRAIKELPSSEAQENHRRNGNRINVLSKVTPFALISDALSTASLTEEVPTVAAPSELWRAVVDAQKNLKEGYRMLLDRNTVVFKDDESSNPFGVLTDLMRNEPFATIKGNRGVIVGTGKEDVAEIIQERRRRRSSKGETVPAES